MTLAAATLVKRRASTTWGFIAGAAALASVALLPEPYVVRADLAWVSILSAASLNLLTGQAGQVSLGQAAFMLIGACTAVILDRMAGLGILFALPAGALSAGLVGLVIGIPSLRLRGFYLALTTLGLHYATTFAAARFQEQAGGDSSAGFKLPVAAIGPLEIATTVQWYFFLALITTAVLAGFHNLGRTRIGRAWTAIRDRDQAAAIIGINVVYYKLLAFLLSAGAAGMAGVLQAYFLRNVTVETFTLDLAISFLAMIIIGGLGSVVAGSICGALLVTQLPFVIQWGAGLLPADTDVGFITFDVQAALFGVIIIAFLLIEPEGLVGLGNNVFRRRERGGGQPRTSYKREAFEALSLEGETPAPSLAIASERKRKVRDPLLKVDRLCVTYFRTVRAVHDVTFTVGEGEIVALLGPNGAGKSTTLRAISGFLPAEHAVITSGSIEFAHQRLGQHLPHLQARRGMSIIAERAKIFSSLSVSDNLNIGAIANPHPASVRSLRDDLFDLFPVLKERLEQAAGLLSGGERQMLAIAACLLASPRLMMVDELSLGLAPKIVGELLQLLRRLNREKGLSILLVEQSAVAAFSIADYVHVLSLGRITTGGTPEELQMSAGFREAYLGLPLQ